MVAVFEILEMVPMRRREFLKMIGVAAVCPSLPESDAKPTMGYNYTNAMATSYEFDYLIDLECPTRLSREERKRNAWEKVFKEYNVLPKG